MIHKLITYQIIDETHEPLFLPIMSKTQYFTFDFSLHHQLVEHILVFEFTCHSLLDFQVPDSALEDLDVKVFEQSTMLLDTSAYI